MPILNKLRPHFWDHEDITSGPYRHHFDFPRIWKRAILVIATVALVPLIIWALAGYRLTMETIATDFVRRTSQLISNSRHSVSLFLTERKSVLDFIAHDHSLETLKDTARLADILDNLNKRFGGFMDLGVIDGNGKPINHIGSHLLEGQDFSRQPWFREVLKRGVYISELASGFRDELHLDFAVKRSLPDGSFFVLRAALSPKQLEKSIAQIEVGSKSDLFIINHTGILQTPSRLFGPILNKLPLAVPEYSQKAGVFASSNASRKPIIIGYAYLPQTPYILMMVNEGDEVLQPWYKTTWAFMAILATSIIMILVVTLAVATHLVNQIHEADQERVDTLHQVEYTNKMVSLGRLASGVAHEINNPLAIINEKAGHIKDIFTLTETYARDPKLINLVDSMIITVKRCAEVTRGLLNFARHLNLSVQTIYLQEVLDEVKHVLAKETDFRSISVDVKVSENIPPFESDLGKLEQIFFNLFNNAIGNMKDGGHLDIVARREGAEVILISFSDSGPGMTDAELQHVFEPFFFSKPGDGRTGIGLSVTYALVQEIGGSIRVQSQLGKGTRFTIELPIAAVNTKQKDQANARPIREQTESDHA